MTEPDYHLAQLNVGRLRAPLDTPQLADFVALLGPVNALADRSPGFVWRLQDEAGDATSYRPFDDELIAINFSVWTSFAALWDFVYRSTHLDAMRRRREWFHRMVEPYQVMWWVPAGQVPPLQEAMARLARLREHGPGPEAFTFKEPYPPPDAGPAEHSRSGSPASPNA